MHGETVKFDKPLFTMCIVTCIQTSNIDVFDP